MLLRPAPRVLCVDDDEDSRAMLLLLLKLASVDAEAVETAAEALSLIQAQDFDLCVLDGRLPEMDGFELCRQMRFVDSHLAIVFFSGAADTTDRQKGIGAGADAYVAKPDVDGLLDSVAQLTSHEGRVGFGQTSWVKERPRLGLATRAHGRR